MVLVSLMMVWVIFTNGCLIKAMLLVVMGIVTKYDKVEFKTFDEASFFNILVGGSRHASLCWN